MPEIWRLLQDEAAEGAWNMAVDEAMARAVGAGCVPSTLRFYTWARPTLSLGYLQSARILDTPLCQRLGLAAVRRPTGGRAVIHHHELTWSLALPLDSAWGRLSVPERFRRIARGLVEGLRCLGVAAAVGEAAPRVAANTRPAACFRLRGMPAILSQGRKLGGAAERRWERTVLQHGSLLLDFDPALHAAIFPDWEAAEQEVTWLTRILRPCPDLEAVRAALGTGLAGLAGVELQGGALSLGETEEAGRLVAAKYGSPTWTAGR